MFSASLKQDIVNRGQLRSDGSNCVKSDHITIGGIGLRLQQKGQVAP